MRKRDRDKLRERLGLKPWQTTYDAEDLKPKVVSRRQIAAELGISEGLAGVMLNSGAIPGASKAIDGETVCDARSFSDWMVFERRKEGFRLPDEESLVYFIQAVNDPGAPIKIGVTTRNNLERRLAALQTANPFRLRILATMPGTEKDEARLHESFAHSRLSGEWFNPTEALLVMISGLAT